MIEVFVLDKKIAKILTDKLQEELDNVIDYFHDYFPCKKVDVIEIPQIELGDFEKEKKMKVLKQVISNANEKNTVIITKKYVNDILNKDK